MAPFNKNSACVVAVLQSVDAAAVGHIGVCVFYNELHKFLQNGEFRNKLFLFDSDAPTPEPSCFSSFFLKLHRTVL